MTALMGRLLVMALLVLAGCVNIPPEAARVNAAVSSGIDRLAGNGDQILGALRQMARSAIEERYDFFYDEAVKMVRKISCVVRWGHR